MEHSTADECVYAWSKCGQVLIIALYFENLLFGYSDNTLLLDTTAQHNHFKMNGLRESHTSLEMEIYCNQKVETQSISPSCYGARIIAWFGIQNDRQIITPMEPAID